MDKRYAFARDNTIFDEDAITVEMDGPSWDTVQFAIDYLEPIISYSSRPLRHADFRDAVDRAISEYADALSDVLYDIYEGTARTVDAVDTDPEAAKVVAQWESSRG